MLLMILLGFLQIAGASDHNLVQKSQTQAKYYISNIEKGTNVDANTWALATLATGNEQIRSFIEKKIRERKYESSILSLFEDIAPQYTDQLSRVVFKTGSSTLLIDLLLSFEDKNKQEEVYQQFSSRFNHSKVTGINFDTLCQTLINRENLSEEILSSDSFRLPHFFMLYRKYKLIPSDYLNQIISKWDFNNHTNNSLTSSLEQASYLRVLYLNYQYGKTASFFNDLINNTKFPNSYLKFRLYRYLDYSMYRLGYYDRSLTVVRNFTLPLSKYLNQNKTYLQTKQLQGVYLYSIGKIKAAEKIYQEVLTQAKEKNVNLLFSSLYNNLALVYHRLGEYDRYLEFQFKSLNSAKSKNNYNHQLEILNNLFVYYRRSNNTKNALAYLKQAQQLAQKKDNLADLGKIFTSMGSFFRTLKKDYNRAHEYFSKAKEKLDSRNNAKLYVDLLIEEAETFKEQNKTKEALKRYSKIIQITPKDDNPTHISALVDIALVNLKLKNLQSTSEAIKKFKNYDLNKLDFVQIVKARSVEAEYLFRQKHSKKALNIVEPLLDQIIARAKSSTDLKSGFWHVEDEYLDAFELAVSIYKNIGKPRKAIEKLDQLKTINDASFYQNPLVKSSLLNESELTQYKQLTNQLDATRKKLLTASESQQFDILQTINQLKLKKRKLDRKLTKDVDSHPVSVREVQNNLSAHELVFHITELKDQYYIAQISRSDVSVNTISLDSNLRNLLSESAQQVATHKTNLDSLYKISQILGMNEIPDRIEQITIIPDSYFYQLPIDVLPLQKPDESYSYGDVTYVIENFGTQYLTSLNDFRKGTEVESVSSNRLSYVGYGVSNFGRYNNKSLVPLPFAQTEVTSIADKLTHLPQIQTYLNEQSTKSTFTKTAPNAQIIHLATHSEVSERDPMFSTVYLSKTSSSPDSTFNDQVFAYELFELDLSNDMIMLNSCESGSGSYIQGTGVMGISRALQYAGARSLILNLWSVNDMLASDFAIHFYGQLNQGKSKAEALQNTKRYFLQTKNADPHFWGPYMLIGDTEPIVQPNKNKNLAMASAFIFYFLLMVGLSYLTQQGIIFKKQKDYTA